MFRCLESILRKSCRNSLRPRIDPKIYGKISRLLRVNCQLPKLFLVLKYSDRNTRVSAFIVRSQHSVGPSKIATFIRNEDARASRSNEKLSLSLSRVGWCHGKPLTPIVVSLIFILAFAGRRWRLGNPWSATRSPGPHENANLVRLASKVDGLNVCMAFLLLRVLLVLGGGLMHWVLGGPNARTLRLGGSVWTESLIGMWNIVGSEASSGCKSV